MTSRTELTSDQLTSDELNTEHELHVYLTPGELRASLENDARAGLTAEQKWLPPKYFYDDRGSVLFDEITRLPEYYPTRTEHSILQEHALDIVDAAGADVLLELGSGSSEKTRLLLDAMTERHDNAGYVAVDVSSGALKEALAGLRDDYPDLALRAVVADFDRHLDRLPAESHRLFAFLGSTLGNYPPDERARFLKKLAEAMQPGEALLLGLDLVKETPRLVAAYDDSAGVTADFNRNVLRVLNRELAADFDPSEFDHVAVWNADNEWIEMRLRARKPMTVTVRDLALTIEFEAGEEIRTEISAKFRRERIAADLATAGLRLTDWWTDAAGDFALTVAVREGD